jgi:DNA-binding transcriptional ArsR family regulator
LSAEAEEIRDLDNHEIPRNRAFCQAKTVFSLTGAFAPVLAPFRGGLSDQTEGEAMSFARSLPNHLRRRREKVFGDGRPQPLDREAKLRIMTRARALKQRTAKGKHYGQLTAKCLDVLEALLWSFHNARSGLCFPSLEKIAEKAKVARSTVSVAIKALEDAGLLSWVNRIVRVKDSAVDLFGHWVNRWRILRTSNGYQLFDPLAGRGHNSAGIRANSSKSEIPAGNTIQDSIPSNTPAALPVLDPETPLGVALLRFGRTLGAI